MTASYGVAELPARLAARAAHVWRIGDGKVMGFTDYYYDKAMVDAFWGQPVSVAG
ncbi:MAG TPA: hypothetical protein VFO01_10435 [Trebonia sp.]|nr:hypothetical protein [Trebonia sp.]